MRNKIVFTITILAFLFAFAGCRMHSVQGTPYKVWHVTKRTHKHWGAPRVNGARHSFWGNHRYGPRPHKARGRYRQYQ